jgi:hypothetical protein
MSSNKCSKCKKISLFLICQAGIARKIRDLVLKNFFLNCAISFSYIISSLGSVVQTKGLGVMVGYVEKS